MGDICGFPDRGRQADCKDDLKRLVSGAKHDANEFVRKQGQKLERYLDLLGAGQISKEEFELWVKDLKTLTELRALELEVAAKASTQRLVAGITDLVINGLMKVV